MPSACDAVPACAVVRDFQRRIIIYVYMCEQTKQETPSRAQSRRRDVRERWCVALYSAMTEQ